MLSRANFRNSCRVAIPSFYAINEYAPVEKRMELRRIIEQTGLITKNFLPVPFFGYRNNLLIETRCLYLQIEYHQNRERSQDFMVLTELYTIIIYLFKQPTPHKISEKRDSHPKHFSTSPTISITSARKYTAFLQETLFPSPNRKQAPTKNRSTTRSVRLIIQYPRASVNHIKKQPKRNHQVAPVQK